MVFELLAEGAENARTGKELARALNCDLRTVTEQIERERREGKPICANSCSETPGYYLAADSDELEQYCNRLHRRATELYKTQRALINALRQLPGKTPFKEKSGADGERHPAH